MKRFTLSHSLPATLVRRLLAFAPVAVAAIALMASTEVRAAPSAVNYDRDIRSILANNCYKCHGPDEHEREAGLRLDQRDIAIKPLESGDTAIVPGKPDESELVARINSDDDDQRMPPPESNKRLTDVQRELLKRWIAEGAKFDRHWSYVMPERASARRLKRLAIGREMPSTISFWPACGNRSCRHRQKRTTRR